MDNIDRARVLRWLQKHGGEITRNRLRRYRPRRAAWLPVEQALNELIAEGLVRVVVNELEPLERGVGYATTRYQLAGEAQA